MIHKFCHQLFKKLNNFLSRHRQDADCGLPSVPLSGPRAFHIVSPKVPQCRACALVSSCDFKAVFSRDHYSRVRSSLQSFTTLQLIVRSTVSSDIRTYAVDAFPIVQGQYSASFWLFHEERNWNLLCRAFEGLFLVPSRKSEDPKLRKFWEDLSWGATQIVVVCEKTVYQINKPLYVSF